MPDEKTQRALDIFKAHGGILRTSQAVEAGVYKKLLYQLLEEGYLTRVSRGVYALERYEVSNPDFVSLASKVPEGVICLISALSFHEITTQIPNRIHVAIKRKVWPSKLEHPPVEYYYFSEDSHQAGVEEHTIDNSKIKIYSPEKTIADCFKFRSRLGIDVCKEALEFYQDQNKPKISEIMKYSKINRVHNIIEPYLVAIL